jgi:hypothetical protein
MTQVSEMPWKLRYYRDAVTSHLYSLHGIDKPEGYVTAPCSYSKEQDANALVEHINRLGPVQPAEAIQVWG